MKLLKVADLSLQVLITAIGLTWLIITDGGYHFIYIYFVLGGWQVLSFLIHLFSEANWKSNVQRKGYGLTLCWILVIGLVGYLLLLLEVPLILFYLIGLILVSPIMATWYFIISVRELQTIRNRELVHLK